MVKVEADLRLELRGPVFGIDWLTFSGDWESSGRDSLLSILRDFGLLDDSDKIRGGHGGNGYRNSTHGADMTFTLFWDNEQGESNFCLMLRGAGCTKLGLTRSLQFARQVMETFLGTTVTRVDPYVDLCNYPHKGLLGKMQKAAESGCCYRGRKKITRSKRIPDKDLKRVVGDTLYLGGTSSLVRGRGYQKGLEAGLTDELDKIIRLEYQHNKERANRWLLDLFSTDWQDSVTARNFISGTIVGSFTFQRSTKHGLRRLPWFIQLVEFLGDPEAVVAEGKSNHRDFGTWISWLRGSVSPIRRFQAIADQVNDLYGLNMTAGTVMDIVVGAMPVDDRAFRDPITSDAVKLVSAAMEQFPPPDRWIDS